MRAVTWLILLKKCTRSRPAVLTGVHLQPPAPSRTQVGILCSTGVEQVPARKQIPTWLFMLTRRGPGDGPGGFNRRLHFDFALVFCFLYHGVALFVDLQRCQPAAQSRASLQGETEEKTQPL